MKENKYDNEQFFEQYSQMARSTGGLEAAGEWHELKKLLPDFNGKRVLDLGCGFGWHCIYAVEHGAKSVVGIDLSEKMLARARAENAAPNIEYVRGSIEEFDYPADSFQVVLSSLAFHYVQDFGEICRRVRRCLSAGGDFVFSCEHPVFTAHGTQDWYDDEAGNHLHWPVDRYFTEGIRTASFLGEAVQKYHKTLTTYVNSLIRTGFEITGLVEPQPDASMLDIPGMADELRRPMMLLVSARKK